ncbi:MAG: hypothetical protein IPO37_05890 [Saprospiraceae bacterium]|nr:hypothetical protein [Saprospiraceae bacterium]
MRNHSQELYLKIGKIKKVHDLVPENNLRGSFIIEGAKGSLQVYFTLSPENPPLIQDYQLTELR